MITQKTVHSTEAVGHLLQQFRGKAKLEAFISLLTDQVQELENAYFQISTDTALAVAVGEQLDGWGRILNDPRNGLLDTPYRLHLQAKARVIRSTGTIEDLLVILDLLTGGGNLLTLSEPNATDPATFTIDITPAIPAGVDGVSVGVLTLRAKPAGVKGYITFFDSDGISFDVGTEGFDDADDAFGAAVGD